MERVYGVYWFLWNTDETFLELNPLIKKYGYIFVKHNLRDLNDNFMDIIDKSIYFSLPREEEPIYTKFEWEVYFKRLFDIFSENKSYFYIIVKKYWIFLEKIKDISVEEEKVGDVLITNFNNGALKRILRSLRLLKSDYIGYHEVIAVDRESKRWKFYNSSIRTKFPPLNELSISKDDITEFSAINIDLDYLGNALDFYNSVYDIDIPTVKYLLLISCLEAVFNSSESQISHTISRHLAILISQNKEEFNINYELMKKVYNKRSKIVHWNYHNIDINEVIRMHELCRKVIILVMKLNLNTKKNLFDFLNAKWF
jgi:hypothetical protein